MENCPKENNTPSFRFDCKFFRRFWHLLRVLFPSASSITTLLFVLLLTVCLLEQYIIYNVGLIASGFYKVLAEKDVSAFWTQVFHSLGIIVAISVVKSTRQYVTSVMYLSWRQILCMFLHRFYFADINFYKINVLETSIDNPDQRITQDVDKMCSGFSTIFPSIIIFPFTVSYYTYQAYIGTGYLGPLGIVLFFLFSTLVNKCLMTPIVGLTVEQERREGDFRFKHMQVRFNAESLAFTGAGNSELTRTNKKLNSLLGVQQISVNWQYLLNNAVNLFDYVGSIISYLLLAIPIFNGNYENMSAADLSALISKNAFVCIYLISVFSSVVDLSVKVTDIAGNTHRIAELIERLAQINRHNFFKHNLNQRDNDNLCVNDFNNLIEKNFIGFRAENISFHAPGGAKQMLIKDLSMDFTSGKNILIVGESSSGKTSIVRVLRGLWPFFSGKLEKHFPSGPTGVLFMPSKPFLTDGSLRQQLIYPLHENDADWASVTDEDCKLKSILNLVGLTSLEERTGGLDNCVSWNWYDKLSPGEMQRLCFARLFYHRPVIAVLDEATSAVSVEVEAVLYRECLLRGITLISIGHRQSLYTYHHILIQLDGIGGWKQSKIAESALLAEIEGDF